MSIKILTYNSHYTASCRRCGCEFTFSHYDTKFDNHKNQSYISCPNCNKAVYESIWDKLISSSELQNDQIENDDDENEDWHDEYYRLKFKIQLLRLYSIAEERKNEELKQAISKILKEEYRIDMEERK